jgi:hypothetical protein
MSDRYYVKCSRASKTAGMPQSKPGQDMDGLYTYPKIGHYVTEAGAALIQKQLASRFPGAVVFVTCVPATFDGVSIPGL